MAVILPASSCLSSREKAPTGWYILHRGMVDLRVEVCGRVLQVCEPSRTSFTPAGPLGRSGSNRGLGGEPEAW